MAESFPPVTINFARVNVVGWPGLCLVAIVIALALQFPEARWLILAGVTGGLIIAAALVLRRRSRQPRHRQRPIDIAELIREERDRSPL
jgi:hypothetical protein